MNKPLSVGIVTGSMSRNAGGLFNSVRNSAIHLNQAGVDVSVYAGEDEHSAADMAAWEPLRPQVLPVRFRGIFPFAPDLPFRLAEADHDLLHLHGIWQLQSRAVNRWKRVRQRPVMISPRGMLDPWALANSGWKKKLVGAWFENRNLRQADCLHALNANEAASMRAYGLSAPIAVIPNAAELPDIAPRKQRDSKKTLLFLGRIHPKKGLSELLTAWSKATAIDPALADDWSITIAGWDDGGHLSELTRQIAELGLGKNVLIYGPAFGAEKDRLLRTADSFVLPSFSEGLPMSVLEAWAYRLPVLMSAHCNLPEGFEKGAALQISTDPDTLTAELTAALRRSDITHFGERGRALVEDGFSWPHVAAEHKAVYEWLVYGGKPPACVQAMGA